MLWFKENKDSLKAYGGYITLPGAIFAICIHCSWGGEKKKHFVAFYKTNWANIRLFFLEMQGEFQMLVGKPLNLFEMLSEWGTESNTASATDHLCLFFLFLPAQRLLASFPLSYPMASETV